MKDVLKFIWFMLSLGFGIMALGLFIHILVDLFLYGWDIFLIRFV